MKINTAKLTLTILAAGAALGGMPSAEATPRLMLNGYRLHTNTAPITRNGRVLVPLRDIFEELGATVNYDYRDHTVTARRHESSLFMTLGSRHADINGNTVSLDVPAAVINGRTLVPLRFVSEAFGATVDYDSAQDLVRINDDTVIIDGKTEYDDRKIDPLN